MESENFDQLKKLLTLKRHEQPPPGYFDNFSSKVLARIQSQEQARPLTLWQRLTSAFDARPFMVGAYGLGVVGTLVFAVAFSAKVARQDKQGSGPMLSQKLPSNAAPSNLGTELASQPLNVPTTGAMVASNSSAPSFLFSPNGVIAEPVNYRTNE